MITVKTINGNTVNKIFLKKPSPKINALTSVACLELHMVHASLATAKNSMERVNSITFISDICCTNALNIRVIDNFYATDYWNCFDQHAVIIAGAGLIFLSVSNIDRSPIDVVSSFVVLVLLVFYAIRGGGRISFDEELRKRM